MNRKTLLVSILTIAVAIFAASAWYVSRPNPVMVTATAPVDQQDLLVRPYSPILGREDAPVTVVEFFDPACEACRAFYPVVKEILAQYPDEVRVVLRYTPFHGEGSELAVKVMEAARMQGVFVPVMEALLEGQPEWASHGAPAAELIMGIAGRAGLDTEAAANQILSPSVVGVLNQDSADVDALGLQGTPTFFVNGKPLPEFGVEPLMALIQSEVEASNAN